MKTNKIEIEVPAGKTAKWIDGVLTLVDDKDTRPVTERIKTFEDACNELGNENTLVRAYECWDNDGLCNQPDIDAYLKLRIICAALNEGWEPQFIKDEYRYYPWFRLYTEDEINNMGDEKRRLVRWGGVAYYGANCGLAYAYSNFAWSNSGSVVGSRLCLNNGTLAEYCGKQFIDIWADFILIRK